MIRRNSILCGILVLAVISSACAKEKMVYLEPVMTESEETEAVTPDLVDEPAFCCVYACGAVNTPGVYTVPADARICDVIEAAGGFAENAAEEWVNLAEHIKDEQQIWIPTKEEAGSEAVRQEQGSGGTKASDGTVNLNTATKEELMGVPGIGAAKADSIITYRNEHGAFLDVKDIMQIPGIKEGIFEKIKDSVTVN